MSTRESIWIGHQDAKYVHIYWELADRSVQLVRKSARWLRLCTYPSSAI